MSEKHLSLPPNPTEISLALEEDAAAREAELLIKEAGREAAIAVPRRLFRTAARQDALEAAASRSAIEKASGDKSSPV